MNLGYSSGVAGYIAGLSLTAEYLELEGGSETAEKLILGVTQKMIQEDMVCDVLGGVSGLVLALTREDRWLKNKVTSTHVTEILKWCGDHLIKQQNLTIKYGLRIWKSKEASQTLTGLGHGVSGIALALIRLGEMFHEERYFASAKDAISYEDSVYDAVAGNWPDFRNDPGETDRTVKKFMGGYCAGAPGIGLARLDGLARVKDDSFSAELLRDIKRADRFIRSIRNEGRNHLCCGTAGRIDFLIEKGIRLNDQEALDLALRKLSDLILGRQKRGHYNFHTVNGRYYYNPTLFQGTAGLGYEILRFLAPEKIRSVLV